MQLCLYYVFGCIKCDLKCVSYDLSLESGAATFPWEEKVKV